MAYPSDLEYSRRVVVDDTDPRIKYDQGSWAMDTNSFDGITIFGAPYNGTQHGTASSSASFSFQFEGEFVQVRGTKDNRKVARPEGVNNDNTTLLAKWTCQVDGSAIKTTAYRPYAFDVTNNMLCEQGKLSHGPHTLTVNVTIDDPNTQMFWLDKVEYTPLPDANLAKEVMKYDSSDPSIQVDNSTGNWKTIGSLFNGTGTTGASASFKFNGTSVSLYGFNEGSDQTWQPTTGRYYIDNKGDTSFDITGSKTLPGLPNNKTDMYHQLWFTASNLNPGSHEMILTFNGVYKSDPIQWLSIDYFYVTASEGSQLNAGNPAGGGGGKSGEGDQSSSNGGDTNSSKTNVGAIAGGVVGGVLALTLIGFAIFFLKKRKAKENYAGQYDGFQPQNMYSSPVNPGFVSTGSYVGLQHAPPSIHSTMSPNSMAQHTTGSIHRVPMLTGTVPPMSTNYDPYNSANFGGSNYGGSSSTSDPANRNSMVVSNPGASSSTPNQNWADMKNAQRDAVSTTVTERQHQDSGIRYPQPGTVVDIPPTYTES
ncbi:hypothetical protein L218DRAFT_950612 [Marasmius fiardii PR-910]|nr:hypothetical protein L218DRAFT_950612 [Marasmius fiardii PR-910]